MQKPAVSTRNLSVLTRDSVMKSSEARLIGIRTVVGQYVASLSDSGEDVSVAMSGTELASLFCDVGKRDGRKK
jgi:hypothetical protein